MFTFSSFLCCICIWGCLFHSTQSWCPFGVREAKRKPPGVRTPLRPFLTRNQVSLFFEYLHLCGFEEENTRATKALFFFFFSGSPKKTNWLESNRTQMSGLQAAPKRGVGAQRTAPHAAGNEGDLVLVVATSESQSKPRIKMVEIPEPCKELRRRPQLFIIGIISYYPSSARVLIEIK